MSESQGVWPPLPPEPPRSAVTVATILVPLVVCAFAGAALALVWSWVTPDPFIAASLHNAEFDLWVSREFPELMAGRDSAFAIGAIVLGVVSGLILAVTAGRRNAAVRALMWLAGGLIGSVIALRVGAILRPLEATMVDGVDGFIFPLGLRSYGALLIWPFVTAAVAFISTLLAVAFGAEVVDSGPGRHAVGSDVRSDLSAPGMSTTRTS